MDFTISTNNMVPTLLTLISYVALYFVFRKMGKEGWEGIIPFYNLYVLFETLYGDGWKFLLFLVPFYNIYLLFKVHIDLAHRFGKSTGFGIGLTLLNTIFMCILAFSDDAQFEGGEYVEAASEIKNAFSDQPNPSKNADAIAKYKDLLDSGVISEEEFEAKKNELLNK